MRPRRLLWRQQSARARYFRAGGRALGAFAYKIATEWIVVVIESAVEEEGTAIEQVNAVFADHAHATLGPFRRFREVNAAVVAVARRWREGLQVAPACDCEPIAAAQP